MLKKNKKIIYILGTSLILAALIVLFILSPSFAYKNFSADITGYWNADVQTRLWIPRIGTYQNEQIGLVNFNGQDFEIFEGENSHFFGTYELKGRGKLIKYELDPDAYEQIEIALTDQIKELSGNDEIFFESMKASILLSQTKREAPHIIRIFVWGAANVNQKKKPFVYSCKVKLRDKIEWNTFVNENQGFTIDYPSGWYVSTEPGIVTFSNVDYFPSNREEDAYSFLRVLRRVNVNPLESPVGDWFDSYFRFGFSSGFPTKDYLMVNDRDAVRIKMVGVGTDAVIYIADGTDIVEVMYSLDTQYFATDYEAMLQSLSF